MLRTIITALSRALGRTTAIPAPASQVQLDLLNLSGGH